MPQQQNIKFWKEFFQLYRSMPELWLSKSACYRNRALKARSYERLLQHMRTVDPNANIHFLKRKINNLRTSYRREMRKMLESKMQSNNPEDYYVPALWYFNELQFLDEQETGEAETLATDAEAADDSYAISSVNMSPMLTTRTRMLVTTKLEPDVLDESGSVDMDLLDQSDEPDAVQFASNDEDEDFFNDSFNDEADTLCLDSEPILDTKLVLKQDCTSEYVATNSDNHRISHATKSNNASLLKDRESRRRQHSSDDAEEANEFIESGIEVHHKKRRLLGQTAAMINRRRQYQDMDECELIGQRMAAHFRNMRADQRLFAERIMSEVLVYGRMNRLSLDARFLPDGGALQ